MNDIVMARPVDAEAELDRLAKRYRAASGIGMRLLNVLGSRAENLLDRLPTPIRNSMEGATQAALKVAMEGARQSRRQVPDQKAWINTAMTTAMGAAGGMGGLPTAMIELPATTTVLMRAIQGVAAENGFNPDEESVQFDCLRVFAAAGPLDQDDGADLSFVTLRLTLTGPTMHRMIAAVAPKLATVLGQKLATQTVPLLGAVAGATTNYLFTSYYQEIAQVHFGLRRLAIDSGVSEAELVTRLNRRMAKPLR